MWSDEMSGASSLLLRIDENLTTFAPIALSGFGGLSRLEKRSMIFAPCSGGLSILILYNIYDKNTILLGVALCYNRMNDS